MIDKMLDYYYLKKIKQELYILNLKHNLDFYFDINKKELKIKAKPRRHLNYTTLIEINSNSSLNYFIKIDILLEHLQKTIKDLNEHDSWN